MNTSPETDRARDPLVRRFHPHPRSVAHGGGYRVPAD